MNRIILVGNGFNLAHGLKTSYKDFIDWFWEQTKSKVQIKSSPSGYIFSLYDENMEIFIQNPYDHDIPIDIIRKSVKYKNQFLKLITEKAYLKNWVDIEEEYFKTLNEIIDNGTLRANNYSIENLNKDFEQIKLELEKYLSEIQKETISANRNLFFQIYSPLHIEDFMGISIPVLRNTYRNLCPAEKQKEFDEIFDWILNNNIKYCTRKDYDDYVSSINLFPKNVCFLNFNYTDIEKKYQLPNMKEQMNNHNFRKYLESDLWREMCASRKNIHIHGELNNPQNPVIFGYGDELDEEYKKIERLKDNNYLENIKSIKYLETDNYRNIMSFINSDNYQVFVMGHSCGNSDRTLLNTLFEHDNCTSIKVFYHKKSDGTDNYSDIIRNISRNFSDKAKMREKVVNKIYCEPVSQTIC